MEIYEIIDLLLIIALIIYGLIVLFMGGSECIPILIYVVIKLGISTHKRKKENQVINAKIQELENMIK